MDRDDALLTVSSWLADFVSETAPRLTHDQRHELVLALMTLGQDVAADDIAGAKVVS